MRRTKHKKKESIISKVLGRVWSARQQLKEMDADIEIMQTRINDLQQVILEGSPSAKVAKKAENKLKKMQEILEDLEFDRKVLDANKLSGILGKKTSRERDRKVRNG